MVFPKHMKIVFLSCAEHAQKDQVDELVSLTPD